MKSIDRCARGISNGVSFLSIAFTVIIPAGLVFPFVLAPSRFVYPLKLAFDIITLVEREPAINNSHLAWRTIFKCRIRVKTWIARIIPSFAPGPCRNDPFCAVYVPVDMVEEVRQWCRQYRDIKADIKEVSECCQQLIRLHAKEKRTRSGKRRRSNDP